ncbi:MAG TPA: STAS/SEC14 domain-containing protein [Acidobacteriota bacterium]|nr:STAS/SEC14 domain-containing protein [Acidobacteriota bacterium]
MSTLDIKGIAFKEKAAGKILEVMLTGKLEKEDYKAFAPEVDRLVKKHGKLRVLCVMEDFHGWTAGALWEDVKVDLKHFNDIERLALVGDKKWQKGMAVFCKPFTTAEVRYYEKPRLADARRWIEEGLAS